MKKKSTEAGGKYGKVERRPAPSVRGFRNEISALRISM